MSVADNLARIRETIGSRPVRLIAVTKDVGIERIEEAITLGVTEFGESKVQDALDKQARIPSEISGSLSWHFIGHLQTNKVKKVVGRFALIHSVDSLRLAREISLCATCSGVVQPVLLQVNVVGEASKFGFSPGQIKEQFPELASLPALRIEGLMTMAPFGAPEHVLHQCFFGLAALRNELGQIHGAVLPELSMGMSDDWHRALAEGATMVRLGRAIFGDRSESDTGFRRGNGKDWEKARRK